LSVALATLFEKRWEASGVLPPLPGPGKP
jgi:hypothetical protein